MAQDPYEIELADVAKEIGGNLVITFHTMEVRLTCEQLQELKAAGNKTTIMNCVFARLVQSGMTDEEIKAFIKEADEDRGEVSVAFEAPDDGALNIKSKNENPMLDQMVQAAEEVED